MILRCGTAVVTTLVSALGRERRLPVSGSLLRNAQLLAQRSPDHPDAGLIAAASNYGIIHRRIGTLFRGPGRIEGEAERSRRFADLTEAAAPLLARLGNLRATTIDGHKARAAAFLAWDEGELVGRASRHGLLEDRLLAAILLDLIEG